MEKRGQFLMQLFGRVVKIRNQIELKVNKSIKKDTNYQRVATEVGGWDKKRIQIIASENLKDLVSQSIYCLPTFVVTKSPASVQFCEYVIVLTRSEVCKEEK